MKPCVQVPLLACASAAQQRWGPGPDSSPPPVGAGCRPSAHWTGPAAWMDRQTEENRELEMDQWIQTAQQLQAASFSPGRHSPVTSSGCKHFMERELSVQIPLNDVDPLRVPRLAVQLLGTKKTQAMNAISQLLQMLLCLCGKRLQSTLATRAADLELPLILLPLYFGSSKVEPGSAPQGWWDSLLAALFHLPVTDARETMSKDDLEEAKDSWNFFLRPEWQTFLCFFNMNLSQLLSISSHLASRCLSTALGISSALQRDRDSWSHLHQTGDCFALLSCVLLPCPDTGKPDHSENWVILA